MSKINYILLYALFGKDSCLEASRNVLIGLRTVICFTSDLFHANLSTNVLIRMASTKTRISGVLSNRLPSVCLRQQTHPPVCCLNLAMCMLDVTSNLFIVQWDVSGVPSTVITPVLIYCVRFP